MNLSELLSRELIVTKAACASKDELIAELVERICQIHRNLPFSKDELLNSTFIREKIGGTMLPSGLSVPHARVRNFEDIIAAVATPAGPVFHEGIRIRLMALMLTSQTGGAYYLPAIAALTKISRDEEYFSRLSNAENQDAFLAVLSERDSELG